MATQIVESAPALHSADAGISVAGWATDLERSVLRDMIAVVSQPGILSFAGGLPDPWLFPVEEYTAALTQVLRDDAKSMQYGPPFAPLKEHIVDLMARRGVSCRVEQVFITTGAQQALNVLARLLLNQGGEVLLEQVVYSGIQQAVAPLQPNILGVATDLDSGIDVEAVASLLAEGHRPAFIYLIPDGHNPLGVSLSAAKRRQLAALARRYHVPIVEDDPYGFLLYDEQSLPPVRALEEEWVFYVGSFSKIMAPALRLGWLVAPEPLMTQLTVVKEAGDLETSALTQRAVATYLDAGHFPTHLDRLRREYRARRNAMLDTLSATFPSRTRWTAPAGGLFVWVELPSHVNTVRLLEESLLREKIAFIPGHAFAVPGHVATNCLRLSFSTVAPEQIVDGISRLAAVVREYL